MFTFIAWLAVGVYGTWIGWMLVVDDTNMVWMECNGQYISQ